MAESMADSTGLPGDKHFEAYNQWSEGGWGSILTGLYLTLHALTAFFLLGAAFLWREICAEKCYSRKRPSGCQPPRYCSRYGSKILR